jgi:excisionase family DNA binding protein
MLDDIVRDVRAVAGLNQSVLAAILSKCGAVQSAVAAELTRIAAENGELVERPSPSTENRKLTAKEIAEHLGVKESWVMSEARAKRIPKHMVGRYVRFDLVEVQSALEQRNA